MRIVVCGAGIIGLATALLLARDGHDVTVLEEDRAEAPASAPEAWDGWRRRGVPQWRQPHNLFPRFHQILLSDLPDLALALEQAQCTWTDALRPAPRSLGEIVPQQGDERFRYLTGRRPVVEAAFATTARRERGVRLLRGAAVTALLLDDDARPVRVLGVRTADGTEHRADLVVDAMGRTSPVAQWLTDAGAPPAVTTCDQGFVYYTRYFRGELPVRMAPGLTPLGSISLLTLPGDGDTWSVTVFGTAHDRLVKQVRDPERFAAVLRACPLHAHWLAGEPITDVLAMGGVLDRHRSFVVDDEPVATGLLVVGDAWACTNPSAGRGISVGLVHAQALRDLLQEHPVADADLARVWHRRTEELVGPFFRNQQRADRYRVAEMTAHRDGTPVPEPDESTTRFLAAASLDQVVFRALLETVLCLAFPHEVLARDEVRRVVERTHTAPPPFPGPDRAQLEALLV